MRVAVLVAASLGAHFAVYAAFDRPAPPLPSLGVEVVTVEIVVGADRPAGIGQTSAPSESHSAAMAATGATAVWAATEPAANNRRGTAPVEAMSFVAVPNSQTAATEPTGAPTPPVEVSSEVFRPESVQPDDIRIAPSRAARPEAIHAAAPMARAEPPPATAAEAKLASLSPASAREPAAARAPRVTRSQPEQRPRAVPARAADGPGRGRSHVDANYRGRVAAHLARHKRFPAEARSRGQEGSAVVGFALARDGRVTRVTLVRGSGVESLDREATGLVQRASPFPPPPDGQAVSFTVPLRFRLD